MPFYGALFVTMYIETDVDEDDIRHFFFFRTKHTVFYPSAGWLDEEAIYPLYNDLSIIMHALFSQ